MIANAAFPPDEDRTNRLEEVKQALSDGQVEEVISNCNALAASCELASKAGNCLYTYVERLRYDRFRAAEYMIGSGRVESGCKQMLLIASEIRSAMDCHWSDRNC
jgi:hypothetical protein